MAWTDPSDGIGRSVLNAATRVERGDGLTFLYGASKVEVIVASFSGRITVRCSMTWSFGYAPPLLSCVRGRIPKNKIVLAFGAIVVASLTTAVRAPATPNMKGAVREPAVLQEQVIHLFDRLDHVSQILESVRADIEWARARISELSRQIEAKQQLLNRRAAEAYMAGLAGAFDSALGASSFSDLQDALEFLDAVSQRDHDVLIALEKRKAEIERQRVRLEALEAELRGRR